MSDLFDWEPPQKTGLELGHEAAERAADAAGEAWKEAAFEAFCEYAVKHGSCTTEDVRSAHPDLATPPSGVRRAWGQVALRAKREGLVRAGGWVSARDPLVHGNAVTLWILKNPAESSS
jgi:hypothetical protein